MHTARGILAILFWSTTVAFSRRLSEQLGTLSAAASIYLLGGIWGCGYLLLTGWRPRELRRLPAKYLYGCGSLFVAYMVCLYLAIGLAASRTQVIEVGIINYLWPGLTLVLSVPLLKKKARLFLYPGALLAFAGVVLATLQEGEATWAGFGQRLQAHALPYVLALGAAVSWALYSTLSRRWGSAAESGAVPLFVLATGVIFGGLWLIFPEQPRWTPRALGELAYLALVPTLLAYIFWDAAMRQGRLTLVVSFSYLTPILSTMISCLYLGVPLKPVIWLACGLVIGGAVVCKAAIVEPAEPAAGAAFSPDPG